MCHYPGILETKRFQTKTHMNTLVHHRNKGSKKSTPIKKLILSLIHIHYALNMNRPLPTEYPPQYQPYINLVQNGNFLALLTLNKIDLSAFFKRIPKEKHNYKYAENKWTIKEVLMHLIDTERVFSYRALACARGDKTSLPNMDENLYAQNVDVSTRTLQSLIEEFEAVRESSILLFEYMSEEKSRLLGHIGENAISARALGYLIIGHALHHIAVIKERYL